MPGKSCSTRSCTATTSSGTAEIIGTACKIGAERYGSGTTYSHSRLSCFEQCPRHYKFRYIDEIEVEELQGIEAFSGTMVHLALQRLHEEAANGRILEQSELVDLFRSIWKENYDGAAVKVVKKGDSVSDHIMRSSIGLVAYHRRYHPFDHGTTVGLEHEIKFKVRGEREHDFIGYIDRLTKHANGIFEVHDYKTGQRMPAPHQLKSDRQLALYEIGVRQNFAEVREVRLVWHYMSHDKELTSTRTAHELHELEANVAELIERIEATEEFRCNRSPLCRWCEYQGLCQ